MQAFYPALSANSYLADCLSHWNWFLWSNTPRVIQNSLAFLAYEACQSVSYYLFEPFLLVQPNVDFVGGRTSLACTHLNCLGSCQYVHVRVGRWCQLRRSAHRYFITPAGGLGENCFNVPSSHVHAQKIVTNETERRDTMHLLRIRKNSTFSNANGVDMT